MEMGGTGKPADKEWLASVLTCGALLEARAEDGEAAGRTRRGAATVPVRGVSVPVPVKEKIRPKDKGVFWTSLLAGPTCRGCRTMKTWWKIEGMAWW
jgi:hypothetical protein